MSIIPFDTGAVLVVDKPLNWTSFDVVKKIRYEICKHYNIKKIKVGHAGTLDPLASGVVVLCTGKKTKTIEYRFNEVDNCVPIMCFKIPELKFSKHHF